MKPIYTEPNAWYLPPGSIVETYSSDTVPDASLCASVYGVVFKDGALLLTELKEGERPTRMFDIPGGHVDEGETLDQAVMREVWEETGVRVRVRAMCAYKKITITIPKPEGWKYPYPIGYMALFLCEIVSEEEFVETEDTHGRVWLPKGRWSECPWCVENRILLETLQ